MPRLRMNGAIPLLSLYVLMAWTLKALLKIFVKLCYYVQIKESKMGMEGESAVHAKFYWKKLKILLVKPWPR